MCSSHRTIYVCTAAADWSTGAQTFQFSVNGGTAFSVAAGSCAPAIVLPTANDTASVSEESHDELPPGRGRGGWSGSV